MDNKTNRILAENNVSSEIGIVLFEEIGISVEVVKETNKLISYITSIFPSSEKEYDENSVGIFNYNTCITVFNRKHKNCC